MLIPVILVINKADTFGDKREILPLIQERAKLMNFAEIVPVSALRGANLEHLSETIEKYLPYQPHLIFIRSNYGPFRALLGK